MDLEALNFSLWKQLENNFVFRFADWLIDYLYFVN